MSLNYRGRRPGSRADSTAAAAFIAPGFIGFAIFVLAPTLVALALSFFSWDLFTSPRWVGIDNFVRMFADPAMWRSLLVSAQFVALGVIPTIVLGFMLAVIINVRIRGILVLRFFYFAPMVASAAVAAVLWSWMYNPRVGVVNSLLRSLGISGPSWLSDPAWALPALSVMLTWLSLPLAMILYLAGLQRIPQDVYSAADLDGAGWWRKLISITWPNVASTTFLIGILQLLNFLSGSFEVAVLMTNGGPLNATQSLTLYAYKTAFERSDMGYASTLALFQLVLVVAIVIIGRLITNRKSA